MQVPLAEHFHSIQGEGAFCGLPMHFLRFPGCTVGKTPRQGAGWPVPGLKLYDDSPAKLCTAFTGEHFWCDTDYDKHQEVSIAELLEETHESTFCFTGGEPLMHQSSLWYKELFNQIKKRGKMIHVETSGTIFPSLEYDWITISPKANWSMAAIRTADQLKFLISSRTTIDDILQVTQFAATLAVVYLSPIFDPNEIVQEHLTRAFQLLAAQPHWRLGCQWHKFLNLR